MHRSIETHSLGERFAGVGNPLAIGPVEPGGRLYLADVVVQRELTEEARSNPDLWAACVAGALVESELVTLAGRFGINELILGLVLMPGMIVGYLVAGYLSPCIDRGYSRIAVLLISSISAGLLILRSI